MAEEYRGEVVFVGVSNNDTVEDGKAYAEEFVVPYALAHAPRVWELYAVPYQPVTVIIDRDGAIAARIDGPVTYDSLKDAIRARALGNFGPRESPARAFHGGEAN